MKFDSASKNWLTALRTASLNLLLALTLAGCATGQPSEAVNHGFEIASTFDAKNLDIEYIGYCYGERQDYRSWARNCSIETATEKANNGTGHAGAADAALLHSSGTAAGCREGGRRGERKGLGFESKLGWHTTAALDHGGRSGGSGCRWVVVVVQTFPAKTET